MAALQQWPESGIPDNPGAWLMGTAKRGSWAQDSGGVPAVDDYRPSRVEPFRIKNLLIRLAFDQLTLEGKSGFFPVD